MKPFLYYVAQDLIRRYGNNLSEVTIVFPGKRAQLYMNSFLSHFAQGPVWAPRFKTIDELFQQFSPFAPSESVLNVCLLHRIYATVVPNPASLDDFYGWGEILMNDFDDIDKHLVDAEKLFTNAADLSAMDRVDYLSDNQIKALRDFFAQFSPERQSDIKQRFMEMWRAMPEMYHRLKAELQERGLMYRGALYREVAEKIKREELQIKDANPTYCFVGFNVLDEVEETLFAALRDAGKALFYWDYDTYYASPGSKHEAGLFLRHNLKYYPQALPDDVFDNLITSEKRIHFVATSTDNAQVRYLPQWITGKLTTPEHETAVILCDESLMRPTMHAIPSQDESDQAPTAINITMGYPMTDTAIYGYFAALIDLQVEGYNTDLKEFLPTALERLQKNTFFTTFPESLFPLTHQKDNLALIDWLITAIEALGQSLSTGNSPSPYDQLYAESTFQLYRILTQFRWLLTEGILNVKAITLRRLVNQALQTASIPFHGEMDEGLQIMGLLEARNLDFRHLIMLSVGEGIIPRKANETSLIPYILRAHFRLDTIERQDAVYAYSFFRLLQRAEDITLVYNENSSGTTTREQSRFLRQLATESNLSITFSRINAPLLPSTALEHATMTAERPMQNARLSPSAINTYITCPLKYYYQYVARLRMPDRPQDGIDAPHFGTLFHDACEHFYRQITQQTGRQEILRTDLEPFTLEFSSLIPYVDWAFEHNGFPTPSGLNMIIRNVILRLLHRQIKWDWVHTPFTLCGMESSAYINLDVPVGDKTVTLRVGGRIDRMDIMEIHGRRVLRVVDYKTGKPKDGPKTVQDIFTYHKEKANSYYLQTFLYSIIVSRNQTLPVTPCLFYILAANADYDSRLKLDGRVIDDITPLADEYMEGLRHVISEICDPRQPFQPTDDKERCKFCDFRRLCER